MIQDQQDTNETQKKKVRNQIEKLENHLRLDEKIINLKIQLDKLRLQKTTASNQNNINEMISQLEVAIFNYEEEKKIFNYTNEQKKQLLDSIKQKIQQIRPLPFSCQNKRQIHKDLKNLNRFEEHFLILRVKSSDEEFVIEASKILNMVCEKKREIKSEIDQSREKIQENELQTGNIEEDQVNMKIEEQNEKIIQQETPTLLGNIQENTLNNDKSKISNISIISQEDEQNNEQICESEKCQICFAKKRKFVAIPCGHFIYCQACKELVLQKLKCLLCRQHVFQMIEIFS